MIPQDPIMFAGTLRYNLDPFDESTDERMTELIKKAGLEYLLEGVSKKELKDKEEKEAKEKARKALLPDGESSGDEKHDDKKKKEDEKDDKKKEGGDDKKEGDKDKKVDDDKKDEDKKDGDEKDKDKKDEDDGKGLKFKVQDEGKNLSIGERQLICIIRAILRCNKIVILDEATANIDVVTE